MKLNPDPMPLETTLTKWQESDTPYGKSQEKRKMTPETLNMDTGQALEYQQFWLRFRVWPGNEIH